MITAENHPWESIYKRDGHIFTEPFHGFGEVVQKFSDHRCERILDLGCGNGRHIVALSKLDFNAIGLDISKSGLNLARNWLEKDNCQAGLVCADARRFFPFTSNCFDGVISTQVIHHAFLAEIRVTIQEIWRILSIGGLAFVSVAAKTDADEQYQEIEPGTFVPLHGTEKGLPHHIFSEEELRLEFQQFKIQGISLRAEGKVMALWLMKVSKGT
jgi:SAM-dependent methyltransferase